ncbi:Protein fam72a [Rhizopus azygosporus]|uniref:Protein fam72a n=1 Tax=Rhizopus azygosporus TaxID=86630 RepID=A0A367KC05_RHIAZ|nr:Protein fam72a [Rhizopus azygosporus]
MSAPFYLADIGEVIMEWQRVNDRGGVGQRPVYRVECGDCSTVLSDRCMRAALLSDKKTVIYSTDMQPTTVGYIYGDYSAPCCGCRLRDIACIACGKELGYNITFPCTECLSSENNSHYWMFRECNVTSKQILFEGNMRYY